MDEVLQSSEKVMGNSQITEWIRFCLSQYLSEGQLTAGELDNQLVLRVFITVNKKSVPELYIIKVNKQG
jgi:hypothetical protein